MNIRLAGSFEKGAVTQEPFSISLDTNGKVNRSKTIENKVRPMGEKVAGEGYTMRE